MPPLLPLLLLPQLLINCFFNFLAYDTGAVQSCQDSYTIVSYQYLQLLDKLSISNQFLGISYFTLLLAVYTSSPFISDYNRYYHSGALHANLEFFHYLNFTFKKSHVACDKHPYTIQHLILRWEQCARIWPDTKAMMI